MRMRSRLSGLTTVGTVVGVCAASLVAVTNAVNAANAPAPVAARSSQVVQPSAVRVIGKSVEGRNIVARRYGAANATKVSVIIGSMHGTELAGFGIVKSLFGMRSKPGTATWIIRDLNPDGSIRHQRKNARGVDLNRNGSHLWKGTARAPDYYPGPRALSEPETRAYIAFLSQIRPDMVIIYHQHANGVDSYRQKNANLTRGLAQRMRMPVKSFNCDGECTGTLTGWYNTTFPGAAITVELPARVSARRAHSFAIAAKQALDLVPNY